MSQENRSHPIVFVVMTAIAWVLKCFATITAWLMVHQPEFAAWTTFLAWFLTLVAAISSLPRLWRWIRDPFKKHVPLPKDVQG